MIGQSEMKESWGGAYEAAEGGNMQVCGCDSNLDQEKRWAPGQVEGMWERWDRGHLEERCMEKYTDVEAWNLGSIVF